MSFQLEKNKSIKEAMNVIDKNGIGTVLVVDNKKVIGIVTDGDIRRAVMAGHDVNSCVDGIMNKEPVLIKNTDLMNAQTVDNAIGSIVRRVTNDSERFIPIVNNEGQVIDLVLSKNLRSYTGPKAKKVKKALIAGGAGYLGSILARKLLG